MTLIRPKLMILGDARHGKDTVGEFFVKKGYTFVSSSRFVGERVVWPTIQQDWRDGVQIGPYNSFEECFEDRGNHRAYWFDAITAYNRPDRSRLGRELFAEYDMYVGLRNHRELNALKLHKAFDLAIYVDASERCSPEPRSSCTIEPWMADIVVDNNGTLEDLDKGLEVLYNKWVRPLERRDWTKDKLDSTELLFKGPLDPGDRGMWQVGESQLQPGDVIRMDETGEMITVNAIGAYLLSSNETYIEVTRQTYETIAGNHIDTRLSATIVGAIPQ